MHAPLDEAGAAGNEIRPRAEARVRREWIGGWFAADTSSGDAAARVVPTREAAGAPPRKYV